MENRMLIEISSIYDGTCVIYYPREKRFKWEIVAIQRTTEQFRKDFESKFLKALKTHDVKL